MMIYKGENTVQIVGYILVGFYLLGLVFPDSWWGTHYIAFLPKLMMWILLILGSTLLVVPRYKPITKLPWGKYLTTQKRGGVVILSLSLLISCLFYLFQISFDDYGDAFQYRAFLGDTLTKLPEEIKDGLFSFNVSPSSGRKTVLFFYNYLSYIGNISIGQVFKWSGIICGFGYIVSWLLFVRFYLKRKVWKVIMALIGIFAPFTQIFYGHIETYAFVFLFFISWILLILVFYKSKRTSLLWILLILLLVCLKIHPLCFLLIPIWLLALISHKFSDSIIAKKLLTWKGVLSWMLAPLFFLGAIIYFFVLEDYNDPRFLNGVKDIDRLFLPIVSPDTPLDRYNLFSWNHIFDYFNLFLSWSSPALFILAGIVIQFRKKINWNAPEVIALGLLLILCSSLLFMLNPLVSMPMDWDLFSFASPMLITMVVVLLSKIEMEISPQTYLPTVLILLVFSIPQFIVNSNSEMISRRLTSVGIRVYKTYYLHSNRIIINALNLLPNMEDYLVEKEIILNKTKPFAIPEKDPLYANLLMDDGFYYLNVSKNYSFAVDRLSEAVYYYPSQANKQLLLDAEHKLHPEKMEFNPNMTVEEFEKEGLYLMRYLGDFKKARDYFEKVLKIHPDNPLFIMYAMEACFQMDDFKAAYYYATGLILFKYPDENKSLRIATHCALEAKLYNKAKEHTDVCITKFPEDALMSEINNRLLKNENVEELKFRFIKKLNN